MYYDAWGYDGYQNQIVEKVKRNQISNEMKMQKITT